MLHDKEILTAREICCVHDIWILFKKRKVELEDCLQEARLAKWNFINSLPRKKIVDCEPEISSAVFTYCDKQNRDACSKARSMNTQKTLIAKKSDEDKTTDNFSVVGLKLLEKIKSIFNDELYNIFYKKVINEWSDEEICVEFNLSRRSVQRRMKEINDTIKFYSKEFK